MCYSLWYNVSTMLPATGRQLFFIPVTSCYVKRAQIIIFVTLIQLANSTKQIPL